MSEIFCYYMNGKNIILFIIICICFNSCFHEDTYEDTKKGNFEALWKIMDERYCFFEYKNIDWDEVHDRYAARISENMNKYALFEVLDEMLQEVKDGHVNLYATHNVGRYTKWYDDYADNFDEKVQKDDKYLGTDYKQASGIKYKRLMDNIGYIYYGSFQSGLGGGNLDEALWNLAICDGIIIDVRDNGGGFLTNSEKLAERFFKEKTLVAHMLHKTGKGHNDFSKPYKIYVEPPGDRIPYLKKVVVLTNRRCFSATNDFVNAMSYAPYVTLMGDKTGGGSGLPFSSEIPNGWSVRFSASPMLNAEMEQIEFGIEPDIRVRDMTDLDILNRYDPFVEAARDFIKGKPIRDLY